MHRFKWAALTAVTAAIAMPASASAVELVQDGGFEGGTPNPSWDEASTNFPSPICDVEQECVGSATHSGVWFAWFGGAEPAEQSSLEQDVTIPAGHNATLTFWLNVEQWNAEVRFTVSLNGTPILTQDEVETGFTGDYAQVSLDVSSFPTGIPIPLRFEYSSDPVTGVENIANFFVDDVSLDATPKPPPPDTDPPDTDPPETTITKHPPNRFDRSKARFKFVSDEAGTTFECKIDRKPFQTCTSPKTVKRLDDGKHKFKVRAIDAAGNVDPTPAKDRFRVVD